MAPPPQPYALNPVSLAPLRLEVAARQAPEKRLDPPQENCHIRDMQAVETIAQELNLPPETVAKESLKALLERHIHQLSLRLVTICRKYGVDTYSDFDQLIREGKVEETKVLDDFQTVDHLEAQIRRLKTILFDQIDS